MGQFKKGDWVRFTAEKPRYGARHVATPVKVVKLLNDYLVGVSYPVEGILQSVHAGDLEHWQPKVGERVRYVASYSSGFMAGKEATVVEIVEPTRIMVDTHSHWGRCTENIKDLEPITDSPPVAEQPAALTIQAGKFYKTRDGRKVGPMKESGRSDDYVWTDGQPRALIDHYSRDWCEDGVFHRIKPNHPADLIAEWIDTPVVAITAATVDAINDEYGPVVREVPVLVAEQPARPMIRTKNGYGFELARVGDYVWVDIGQKAPITVRADTIKAA